jgi:glycogen operon protein
VFLNGQEIGNLGHRGEQIDDDSFLVLFNAHHEPRTFMLPRRRFGAQWSLELSTSEPETAAGSARFGARTAFEMPARSIAILKRA